MVLGRRLRRHRLLAVALAVGVVALGASPLLHHDLACHLKVHTHCSHALGHSGVLPAEGLSLPVPRACLGAVVVVSAEAPPQPFASPSSGRSPPL